MFERTRSLSRRALGGDRDPGRLHRLRPCRAHPRDAGRQPSAAAGGRRRFPRGRHLDHAFRRHAGGADPGRCRLSRASDHHLVPDLRAGGRHFPVLRQHRRTVAAARDLVGGAARGRHRQHALCRHPRAVGAILPSRTTPHDPAVDRNRDRHRLWRPARLPGPAGRRPADRSVRSRSASRCPACTTPRCTACISCRWRKRPIAMPAGWRRRSRCLRWSWRCCALSSPPASCCSLVPDPRRQAVAAPRIAIDPVSRNGHGADPQAAFREPAVPSPRLMPAPLGGLGQPPRAAPARPASGRGRRRHPFHRCRPRCAACGPTPIIRGCMTAPASGCARGRSRKPRRSSIPACSSGCTAAISSRSPMSASSARKAMAP